MGIQQQRESKENLMYTYKIFSIIFISVIITNVLGVAIIKGTESNSAINNSTTQDSVTLIYNDIDALSFPRIISIVTVMN